MSPVPSFSVTVEPLEGTCLIRAAGELDRSTADRLGSALDAARADGVTELLDLSAVSFIDSAGLRVLLRSARAVDAHDWALYIVRASSVVWRLVELSGTRCDLPLVLADQDSRIFQNEFLRVSVPSSPKVHRSHPRTSIRSPSTVVPLIVHSETPETK